MRLKLTIPMYVVTMLSCEVNYNRGNCIDKHEPIENNCLGTNKILDSTIKHLESNLSLNEPETAKEYPNVFNSVKITKDNFQRLQEIFTQSCTYYKPNKTGYKYVKIKTTLLNNIIGIMADSDLVENGLVTAIYFPYAKDNFEYYVISLSKEINSATSELYFFKNDMLLLKRHNEHHYGIDVEWFTDEFGLPGVCYTESLESGTGIATILFKFFNYSDNIFFETLTLPETAMLNSTYPLRNYNLRSTILSYSPLKINVNYQVALPDSSEDLIDIFNDSTVITFSRKTKTNEYTMQNNKFLNEKKISSYRFDSYSEINFLNGYKQELKNILEGCNNEKKRSVEIYLNEILKSKN